MLKRVGPISRSHISKHFFIPFLGSFNSCTISNPCEVNEGDCDTDDECKHGLSCGSNNCADSLGFDTEVDCCFVG